MGKRQPWTPKRGFSRVPRNYPRIFGALFEWLYDYDYDKVGWRFIVGFGRIQFTTTRRNKK